MPTRPIHTLQKEFTSEAKAFQTSAHHHPQHGHHHSTESRLLDVPAESLTHITSYLTPPSLLTLATTCRSLYEHVKDDNTWLRAFLNQFLSISPERELENEKILPLRRMENTWRKEFILRYSFRRYVLLKYNQSPRIQTAPYQTLGAFSEPHGHPYPSRLVD
jgi:hypothetical protein